jgi:hypothetical protein
MNTKKLFYSLIIIFFAISAIIIYTGRQAAAESLQPLSTEDANILAKGSLQLRLDFEYLDEKDLPFDTTRGGRDAIIAPGININLAPSKNIELQAYFDGIYADENGVSDKYGPGDVELHTKFNFKKETKYPATSIRCGVKLPTADDADNLGTDEADFSSSLLFSKKFDNVSSHLNLGLAILGNPNENCSQDDVLTYGLGFIIPTTDNLNLAFEVNGQALSRHNNNFSCALCGFQYKKYDYTLGLGIGVGLTEESQDWSVKIGITKDFDNFFTL